MAQDDKEQADWLLELHKQFTMNVAGLRVFLEISGASADAHDNLSITNLRTELEALLGKSLMQNLMKQVDQEKKAGPENANVEDPLLGEFMQEMMKDLNGFAHRLRRAIGGALRRPPAGDPGRRATG